MSRGLWHETAGSAPASKPGACSGPSPHLRRPAGPREDCGDGRRAGCCRWWTPRPARGARCDRTRGAGGIRSARRTRTATRTAPRRGATPPASPRQGWCRCGTRRPFRGFSTRPWRFACWARTRSRPRSRISAALPPGQACPSASFAASSFSRKRRETVTCTRASSASSSSTDSRGGGGAGRAWGQPQRPERSVHPGEPRPVAVHPGELGASATRARLPGARPGPWPLGAPARPAGPR